MQEISSTETSKLQGGRLKLEKRSIDYVPLSERHGRVWHLGAIWFSGSAQIVTVAVGVIGISMGANFIWTVLAVIIGCAFGTFFMAFHSTQGPQLGLPQMIQSRPQFGYMGALLIWVVALINYVGFNAFNQILAGQTLNQLTHVSASFGIFVFTAFAFAFAFLGYHWIHRAQQFLAVLMVAALGIFTVGLVFAVKFAPGQLSLSDFKAVPFFAQLFAAAAYQLSWAIYVSDYSRYMPEKVSVRASFWWTYMGAFGGGAWSMLIGTAAATLYVNANISVAIESAGNAILPGLGTTTLVLSVGTLVTVASLNFYGASLTLLSIVDSFRRVQSSIAARFVSLAAAALVSTSIALAASGDFVSEFNNFLDVLLYLFTPWTAINLVDFYFVRKTTYSVREIFNPRGIYGRWNWRGLTAYFVGFLAMVPFYSTGFYIGPIAQRLGGVDISMIVGLIVSAGLYYGTCQSLDINRELRVARMADADLEPST